MIDYADKSIYRPRLISAVANAALTVLERAAVKVISWADENKVILRIRIWMNEAEVANYSRSIAICNHEIAESSADKAKALAALLEHSARADALRGRL